MPVIIVATDLSLNGNNAAHYAAALAESWGCSLLLLHTYYIPVTFSDPAMPIIPLIELQDTTALRLKGAMKDLTTTFPGLAITSRIEYGDIEDTIETVIEEIKPILIIIGTQGSEGDDSFLASNTSANLLRNTRTPVLSVPGGYSWKPIEQVCIAVDDDGLQEDASMVHLKYFLKRTGATLHIVHVATNEDSGQPIAIPSLGSEHQVVLHPVKNDGNVVDPLVDYVTSHAIDCLLVIPHQYSFWESLFHKSHTKALLYSLDIPVLGLHQ